MTQEDVSGESCELDQHTWLDRVVLQPLVLAVFLAQLPKQTLPPAIPYRGQNIENDIILVLLSDESCSSARKYSHIMDGRRRACQ